MPARLDLGFFRVFESFSQLEPFCLRYGLFCLCILTDRISESGRAIASIRSSVCPFVSTLLNQLTFDLDVLHVSMTMARRGLKVKVS